MKDNNLENTQKNSHLYEIIDVPQATGVMFRTSVDEEATSRRTGTVLSRSSIFLKENWK